MSPWLIMLMPFFEALLKKFMERCEERTVEAEMNTPRFAAYAAMKSVIAEEMGLTGRELRRQTRDGMRELRKLKKREVALLVSGTLTRL